MTRIAFDFMGIRIKCETCDYEGLQPIRDLVANDTAICPRCRGVIDLKDWCAFIDEAAKQLKEFRFTTPWPARKPS